MKIDTGNAAFNDGYGASEMTRILREVSHQIQNGLMEGNAVDINGNTVGDWKLKITAKDG
jgi:hypothetical protein